MSTTKSGEYRNPIDKLADEIVGRFRRGELPAASEYVALYPELAEEIRDLFPALVLMEQLKPRESERNVSLGSANGRELLERLGDYRILRYVGEGGMGIVYEAVRESLRSRVALKVMHPWLRDDARSVQRFQLEACSAAGLHHTNIVSVFDCGEQDGICYYAMQYIQGDSLDKVLADVRRLRAP